MYSTYARRGGYLNMTVHAHSSGGLADGFSILAIVASYLLCLI